MELWLWIILAALFFECKGEDRVIQRPEDVTAAEGDTVTLDCEFETTDSFPYLFWYKQEANSFPQYMLRCSAKNVDKAPELDQKRFHAAIKNKSVPLKIQKLQVSDSAVYYCALQPTVTGNNTTLYKNLWSKDNTILHNIHSRPQLPRSGSSRPPAFTATQLAVHPIPSVILQVVGPRGEESATLLFRAVPNHQALADGPSFQAWLQKGAPSFLQFLRMVGPELEVWIRERDPQSAEEAARLAEIFLSARTGSRKTTFGRDDFTGHNKSNGGERELQSGPVKQPKSRAQKRREKLLATARDECEGAAQPNQSLDFHIPSDIAALQQEDSTLKPWFDRVSEVEGVSQDMKALFISVLLAALCRECRAQKDNVVQPQGDVTAAEGEAVTLHCGYNSSSTGPSLYWYRQDGNQSPKFILSRFKLDEGNTEEHFKERFSSSLNSDLRSVPLKIQKLQVSDSAVYYCALQPTVTGNNTTLYKNLWSKDNTILHNIH
ncbi:uncharacterized protein LOC115058368 [Echeneis naucrates]|uniref:uncharacterized protein LOC115058368 n=1 Tax=Echeneis naucrates TaxID=173247 RepID=UPI001114375C|nr:uncharacterized protein LOC115058368 [Echeneis naucrates]